MEFSNEHNEQRLVSLLNEAVRQLGIVSQPAFTELLQPVAVNLIFADQRNGLIARVRKAEEGLVEVVNTNLRFVRAAVAAGAPILPPLTLECLLIDVPPGGYIATLWPFADNRLVTPKELVEVMHGIHDMPPLAGLPDWLSLRHGTTRGQAVALRELENPPPSDVVDECIFLAEEAMGKLETLIAGAPKILLHGDAHPANVVIFKRRPVAIDMDDFSVGPAEADLSLTCVHAERYPGMDPAAGARLLQAFGRAYDGELLKAMVEARVVAKLVALGRYWSEPGIAGDLLQRIEVIHAGGKFARLCGREALCPFASSK